MSQPANIEQQMVAARALIQLVKENLDHPGTEGEAATSAIMGAIKRVALAGTGTLKDPDEAMEVIAHTCIFLGEFIGMAIKTMPPNVTEMVLELFAQELVQSVGNGSVAAVVSVSPSRKTQQEPVH